MGDLIDQLFQVLQQVILPNWSDLIGLLPWVIVVLVILSLFGFAYYWAKSGSRNRSRVPKPVKGSPPPGVHLPGPSRWPFVAPIGAALLLFSFALPPKDASGNATAPFNLQLLALGLIVTLIAIAGWLWDAMREWRATDHPETAHAVALPAGASAAFTETAVTGSGSSVLNVTTSSSTPGGSYPLTITGTTGPLTHSVTVTLVVGGDFTLSLSPASRTISRGDTTTYTVTITPAQGFSGTVNLSATGVPRSATATFAPVSVVNSGTSILTIATKKQVPKGTATLTISGSGGGRVHSSTVTLVIR